MCLNRCNKFRIPATLRFDDRRDYVVCLAGLGSADRFDFNVGAAAKARAGNTPYFNLTIYDDAAINQFTL
jgi:hypothetical protein